jgi:hypothetical protein
MGRLRGGRGEERGFKPNVSPGLGSVNGCGFAVGLSGCGAGDSAKAAWSVVRHIGLLHQFLPELSEKVIFGAPGPKTRIHPLVGDSVEPARGLGPSLHLMARLSKASLLERILNALEDSG